MILLQVKSKPKRLRIGRHYLLKKRIYAIKIHLFWPTGERFIGQIELLLENKLLGKFLSTNKIILKLIDNCSIISYTTDQNEEESSKLVGMIKIKMRNDKIKSILS